VLVVFDDRCRRFRGLGGHRGGEGVEEAEQVTDRRPVRRHPIGGRGNE